MAICHRKRARRRRAEGATLSELAELRRERKHDFKAHLVVIRRQTNRTRLLFYRIR
jgi:hypothetical protein